MERAQAYKALQMPDLSCMYVHLCPYLIRASLHRFVRQYLHPSEAPRIYLCIQIGTRSAPNPTHYTYLEEPILILPFTGRDHNLALHFNAPLRDHLLKTNLIIPITRQGLLPVRPRPLIPSALNTHIMAPTRVRKRVVLQPRKAAYAVPCIQLVALSITTRPHHAAGAGGGDVL